jgi:hypothetical protein
MIGHGVLWSVSVTIDGCSKGVCECEAIAHKPAADRVADGRATSATSQKPESVAYVETGAQRVPQPKSKRSMTMVINPMRLKSKNFRQATRVSTISRH